MNNFKIGDKIVLNNDWYCGTDPSALERNKIYTVKDISRELFCSGIILCENTYVYLPEHFKLACNNKGRIYENTPHINKEGKENSSQVEKWKNFIDKFLDKKSGVVFFENHKVKISEIKVFSIYKGK